MIIIKMYNGRLRWLRHVELSDDATWLEQCVTMESERFRKRGCLGNIGEMMSIRTRPVSPVVRGCIEKEIKWATG